jgi:hypothetical protein
MFVYNTELQVNRGLLWIVGIIRARSSRAGCVPSGKSTGPE